MSAPCSMGRHEGGRGGVLSMMRGRPCSWAMAASCLDVGDVELGVAEGFGVDGAGLGVDGGADAVEVVGVGEADGDAQAGRV